MKDIFIQLIATWLPALCLSQTTYWVSNHPSDAQLVQYTNLQTAVNEASAGDILYVYPSEYSYGNITVTKSLRIESMGYQFNVMSQPSLEIQTMNYYSIIASLSINTTSEVIIKGLYLNSLGVADSENISIEACYIKVGAFDRNENITILNCFVGGIHWQAPLSYYNLIFRDTNGFILSNSIFYQNSSAPNIHNLLIAGDCGNAIVQNNIFSDDAHLNNCMNINNIYYGTGLSCGNCTVTNNVFTGSYGTNPPGNLYNISTDSIFVGLPIQGGYSFDSKYQIMPTSPAKNYGINGVDCGVFDGDFPYRLSGITSFPIISELQMPTAVYSDDDQMQITVRVKIID